MAANRKQTTSAKTGKKPGRPRKNEAPVKEPESFIRAEAMVILSFAFAVLLFLSNFHLCGMVGDLLRSVQLGLFGIMGFPMPVLLFAGVCFYMSNRGNPVAIRKLVAGIVAFLVIGAFAQQFFGAQPEPGKGFLEYYHLSAASGKGGGLVGGLIYGGLSAALGGIGTFLILMVCLLISVVCITERSIVKAVKKQSGAAYQYAKEDMGRRHKLHAERQEERRRLREEQRVRGVNLSSTDLSAATIPEEKPQTHEETSPASSHQADEFHGTISMQDTYEEDPADDTVPFEADPPEDLAASAQKLVAEGIGNFQDSDDLFGDHTGENDFTIPLIKVPPAAPYEEDDFGGEEIYMESRKPEAVKREDYEPEVDFTAAATGENKDSSSAVDEEPWQTAPEQEPVFAVPEEEKRVVTASGKVIETETELLKKRLESKKQKLKEQDEADDSVIQQIREKEEAPKKEYIFPPLTLLKRGSRALGTHSEKEYRDTAIKLQQTLRDFGVGVTVTNISCGPAVTRYELHPEQGVKVSRIVALSDDIKLSLAAADIRIEAPIPGKSAVGIEVPNKENSIVYLRDLLEADNFQKSSSRLAFAVGKDIGGQVVVTDIAKMPHLLIAGATGSGKSVCINTLIMSIIFKSKPEDVKMIMVDPKVVELSVYNGIPHLLIPVVTDPKKAAGALNWAVAEMTDRYKRFAEYNVREIKGYNAKIANLKDIPEEKRPKKMPQIVIIVDELADLMMVASGEVEDAICRLAQLARAAGIHLVIATQRPSVNVITGLIKANVPSRIAFAVSSGVDSRTIIDMNGAEKLLGKGDMLFYPAGYPKPQRVQGAFVSDEEVQAVVNFLTDQGLTTDYNPEVEKQMNAAPSASAAAAGGSGNGRDEFFAQAGKFIIEKEKASIGMLQRMFKIGFNRAARIMDQLSEAGVVGPEEGTKPRKVLMTMEEFEAMLERGE